MSFRKQTVNPVCYHISIIVFIAHAYKILPMVDKCKLVCHTFGYGTFFSENRSI